MADLNRSHFSPLRPKFVQDVFRANVQIDFSRREVIVTEYRLERTGGSGFMDPKNRECVP
jgi:hypothetical protein